MPRHIASELRVIEGKWIASKEICTLFSFIHSIPLFIIYHILIVPSLCQELY